MTKKAFKGFLVMLFIILLVQMMVFLSKRSFHLFAISQGPRSRCGNNIRVKGKGARLGGMVMVKLRRVSEDL